MSKILLHIFLWVSLFTLSTCKKYPEDKFISFTTVKMRLEGEWQLERIEINDENVGYKYSDSLAPLTFKDYKFWFKFGIEVDNASKNAIGLPEVVDVLLINKFSKKEADAIEDVEVSGLGFGLSPKIKRRLGIGLSTKKRFPINDIIAYNVLTNLLFNYWEIRSLHNKNLVLELTKNNIKHRLHFKKTRNK